MIVKFIFIYFVIATFYLVKFKARLLLAASLLGLSKRESYVAIIWAVLILPIYTFVLFLRGEKL